MQKCVLQCIFSMIAKVQKKNHVKNSCSFIWPFITLFLRPHLYNCIIHSSSSVCSDVIEEKKWIFVPNGQESLSSQFAVGTQSLYYGFGLEFTQYSMKTIKVFAIKSFCFIHKPDLNSVPLFIIPL